MENRNESEAVNRGSTAEPSGFRLIVPDIVYWLPVGLIPIGNGIIRHVSYGPVIGEPWAGWVSALLDCILIILYAALLSPPSRPWLRSSVWLACTTMLHFGFGSLVFAMPIAELLGKYDIVAGEPWLIVNIVIGVAPYASALRLRERAAHANRRLPDERKC